MGYKILKNKVFHIPTDRIKEAEKDAMEEEELSRRISEMTDEEYEEYVKTELAEMDQETEDDYVSEKEFWKVLNEDMELWQAEIRNYENWKKILEISRRENALRYTK